MQTPHDRFFHHVFSQPEHARGELALLVGPLLAPRIDWSTLQALPARFVDPKLSEQRSDVLFSAQWVDGQAVLIYVLFEHQSTVDGWMPLRLLGYMLAIWDRHLKEQPKSKRLPLIVPLVLHHSEGGWTGPMRLSAILDADEALLALAGDHVPDFRFLLDDISKARDEELRGRSELTALGRLALVCLGRVRRGASFIDELRRWKDMAQKVLEAPTGLSALEALLRYIMEASETARDELEAYARELGPQAEEAFMTAAQILRAEGQAEGRAEGRAEVLVKLLDKKFGPVRHDIRERVEGATIEELDRWVERVLSAESIDEMFSD